MKYQYLTLLIDKSHFVILLILIIFPLENSYSQNYEDGISKLASELANKIHETGKSKVAVYNLNNLSKQVSELGIFLAEELSVSLASTGKNIRVIDRSRVEDLITENRLARKGYIDPETAKSLGKLAGIELLITGTITPIGEYFRISIKILDIETATVNGAGKISISRTKDLDSMNSQIINFPDKNNINNNNQNNSSKDDEDNIYPNITGSWFSQGRGIYVLKQNGKKITGEAKGLHAGDAWGDDALNGGTIRGKIDKDGIIVLSVYWGNGTFTEDRLILQNDGHKLSGSWHWYTDSTKTTKKGSGNYFCVKNN